MGTLSKAIGAVGGYVAGSTALKEWLMQRGRPYLFSTSQPPAVAATCIAALEVLQTEPELIEQLWATHAYFKAEPAAARALIPGRSETPDHAGNGRRLGARPCA